MQQKDISVRASREAPEHTLTVRVPETQEEWEELVNRNPEDVFSLAHRQWVVDLQSSIRRNWPEGLREGSKELQEALQNMADGFIYGAAAPRGPKHVSLPEGVKISAEAREALAAQGVVIPGE